MKISPIPAVVAALTSLSLAGCLKHSEAKAHHEEREIVATSPMAKSVVVSQPYVCQIHSQRHIEVRTLERGYLQEIRVKEGQAVKKDDLLFRILPVLYKAKLEAEIAKANSAEIKVTQSQNLLKKGVVAPVDLALAKAEWAEAKANVLLAQAELNFAEIKAPFDGVVDRQYQQLGSLVEEGDMLTTLSDNSLMWVYFNVPERRYLEYKAAEAKRGDENASQLTIPNAKIELLLASGSKFDQTAGDTVTIEGQFNNETGNIAFRADFPNPDRLLRHGQTGTVLIHRTLPNALLIPQRATFEVLDKQYVYVIDKDNVVHPREIKIGNVLEDVFVIEKGLDVKDKIILEGVRQIRDGEKVEYDFRKPADALSHQKFHAE
jgi:membrane fusion protein (multidrug efflux system)